MNLPLDGLVVVDFSKVLAGPLCTQNLADMGADVIKVESIGTGDETRLWPPYQDGMGTVFRSVNRNKRSIAVNLKAPESRLIVERLVSRADVAIESFAPGVAARLGVDYETVRKVNPGVVYCSISGYGQSGPLSGLPGYDLILQAFSGLLAMTGEEGGGPVRSPMSPIDQMTGMNALSGILAALLHRERKGPGAYLEVSLFETSLSLLHFVLQDYWATGELPGKTGCGHPSLVPYQVFKAADKDILIGVPNDHLWRKFCAAAGVPELAFDPRYATNGRRVENADELLAALADLIATRDCETWFGHLTEAGIPCAPINTVAELVAHPHTKARGIIKTYDLPAGGGSWNSIMQPIVFDGRNRNMRLPPPKLGADTISVLKECGFDDEQVAAFVSADIVGEPPAPGISQSKF